MKIINTAVFDKTSRSWTPEPEYNKMFLRSQMNYANDMFRARGHMFLNEIHDMLGINRTQAGAVTGWVVNPARTTYITFGDLTANPDGSFNLTFNIDGVIYDKI